MSKAFTKEDHDDAADRPRRTRTASGLPAGAVNYLTARGAEILRAREAELEKTAATDADHERLVEVREILASATIIPPLSSPPTSVILGATVTVRTKQRELISYRIVGVDEADLHADWVSWQSPLGRALIGSEVGERVPIEDPNGPASVTIVAIDC